MSREQFIEDLREEHAAKLNVFTSGRGRYDLTSDCAEEYWRKRFSTSSDFDPGKVFSAGVLLDAGGEMDAMHEELCAASGSLGPIDFSTLENRLLIARISELKLTAREARGLRRMDHFWKGSASDAICRFKSICMAKPAVLKLLDASRDEGREHARTGKHFDESGWYLWVKAELARLIPGCDEDDDYRVSMAVLHAVIPDCKCESCR